MKPQVSSSYMIVNLAWSDNRWQQVSVNQKVGHSYAKGTYPPHECLNFDFRKKDNLGSAIDTSSTVHGYFQSHVTPKRFVNKGMIFFYSRSTVDHKGYIVGVYGEATLVSHWFPRGYVGFEKNEFLSNISGEVAKSTLFVDPYLTETPYKGTEKRLVGQVGFRYIKKSLALRILHDELNACKTSGNQGIAIKLNKLINDAQGLP
ncbi:MAG: hypothetical protein AAE985_03435 [Thermoplasmataceae archaeon]|jgi:hypothetical protein